MSSPEISRTHWGYLLGLHDHDIGHAECPFMENSEAARHWYAAQEEAERADEHYYEAATLANYCKEV
jgi:hypothetical protein